MYECLCGWIAGLIPFVLAKNKELFNDFFREGKYHSSDS
jgi:hypothetical protein